MSSSPNVTVDAAGLGLTGPTSGIWYTPLPANSGPDAALCGQTLTSSVVLSGDLDCSGVTGTALTLGANVELDGNGHRIIAKNADVVVLLSGANATLRDVEIAGTRGTGTGVRVTGDDCAVVDVVANRNNIGVELSVARRANVANVSASLATSAAMRVDLAGELPTLSNIRLTNSFAGLVLRGSGAGAGGDLDINVIGFTSLAGNWTSLDASGASHFDLVGLTLDGATYGLLASNAEALELDGIDASHSKVSGNGVVLGGSNGSVVDNLVASRRVAAFTAIALEAWEVTGVVATDSDTGLTLTDVDLGDAEPTLAGLDLRRNVRGVQLTNAIGHVHRRPVRVSARLAPRERHRLPPGRRHQRHRAQRDAHRRNLVRHRSRLGRACPRRPHLDLGEPRGNRAPHQHGDDDRRHHRQRL